MTRLREVAVRAKRIGGHDRKPRTAAPGRSCSVCDTILSVYNRKSRCSVHEPYTHHRYRARAKGA